MRFIASARRPVVCFMAKQNTDHWPSENKHNGSNWRERCAPSKRSPDKSPRLCPHMPFEGNSRASKAVMKPTVVSTSGNGREMACRRERAHGHIQ